MSDDKTALARWDDHCPVLDYDRNVVGCICGWASNPPQVVAEYNRHIVESARPAIEAETRQALATWRAIDVFPVTHMTTEDTA